MNLKIAASRFIIFIERAIMFPIIFFSVATISFYKSYGLSHSANSSVRKTFLAFSVIYIIYFFVLALSMLKQNIKTFNKWEYISSYFGDLFNSIIIVHLIGSSSMYILILIIFVQSAGNIYFRYN